MQIFFVFVAFLSFYLIFCFGTFDSFDTYTGARKRAPKYLLRAAVILFLRYIYRKTIVTCTTKRELTFHNIFIFLSLARMRYTYTYTKIQAQSYKKYCTCANLFAFFMHFVAFAPVINYFSIFSYEKYSFIPTSVPYLLFVPSLVLVTE